MAITCSHSTAPGISPRPRCIARSAGRSTTATAPRPTITRCSGRCWYTPITARCSRWRPSRSSSKTERNAAKRLLADLRRAHPHLKLIVVEDALASNAPHIRQLQELNLRFILGAKPSDHTHLFAWVAATPETREVEFTDAKGVRHRFRYLNGAPLNESNFDLEVNFLEYWEHTPDGKVTHFSWVTDFTIDDSNLMTLMRGARARWKVENETFNTLENQGYHFEHNFGHGNNNLSTVLMHLMMLAFLIDQIQQRGCRLFQAALTAAQSKTRLWRKLRARFDLCLIPDWDTLYRSIIQPPLLPLPPDTS
jgi:hypothetical protein